ncbi:TPA: LOW QUALITY PROTEIN: hypothetical protein N0F65_006653 [Lagenidium giganteum]|uniref:Kinesin motor domain-containing protein n=1 Tax=Lagenidium giganteum TaxID=4803 RepID=A0AAV2Z639_9STRA|nr:TPA: LOW QUALITY PROTEIN: hypothetical protein N0F65_006653 [Lagenidium giganteum]
MSARCVPTHGAHALTLAMRSQDNNHDEDHSDSAGAPVVAPSRGRPRQSLSGPGLGAGDAPDAVRVCVRVRPLSSKEKHDQTKSCLRIASSVDGLSSGGAKGSGAVPSQQLVVGKDRAFTFDSIFGVDSTQDEVYEQCALPLVQGFVEGYNATVLAYGQTGTGKTYTMAGTSATPPSAGAKQPSHASPKDGQTGIIPRVIHDVFARMEANQQRVEFNLRVEYIEIYNEELRDLLHPDTSSKQLMIREDGAGNIVVAGVKSEVAQNKAAVFRYFALGGASRATGSTLMNEQSSRSHAIFSLILQQRGRRTGDCRKSKFHLVDLAGSERAKRTGAVAGRFKESVSINQGLLALGNVISALSDEKKRQQTANGNGATTSAGATGATAIATHVPYRDSKLTRMLQDSLGGNAKTLMIACVSPAALNFEETLNTLKYANRAKNIKNRPIVNQQLEDDKQRAEEDMNRMKEEIALLQTQLKQQQDQQVGVAADRPTTTDRQQHQVVIQGLEQTNRTLVETVDQLRQHAIEAIQALIAMEREIKPLGRPVQQRLNDVVKGLNAAVHLAGDAATTSITKKTPRPQEDGDDDPVRSSTKSSGGLVSSALVDKLKQELQNAKQDLARDEQIFEMKNAELKRLQERLVDAKNKNDQLIQRVQALERSGQLWENAGVVELASPGAKAALEGDEGADELADAKPSARDASTASSVKPRASSRGLFTKRGNTAASKAEVDDDNVVIGSEEEDDCNPRQRKASGSRSALHSSSSSLLRHVSSDRVGTASIMHSSRAGSSDAIQKLEKTISSLQAKVEELQQQNGELMHSREESTRRWQVDRQQYERQISEAEQLIEQLRNEKQALEDSLLDDHQAGAKSVNSSRTRTIRSAAKSTMASIDEEFKPQGDMAAQDKRTLGGSVAKRDMHELYEHCIHKLVKYGRARRQVLALLRSKKDIEQDKEDANRRVAALEMQKLRQSLTLKESISDVSKSLRMINDKLQAESRTVEEIERLTKLRERAERKLRKLRQQEEKEQFLDADAQQELADLDELIHDLNSHIAFQDAELAAAREELARLQQQSQVEEAETSPLDQLTQVVLGQMQPRHEKEAFEFIKKCLEEVARLMEREEELLVTVRSHENAISERNAALTQLENGLVAARKEYDRRLELQKQEDGIVVDNLRKELDQIKVDQERQRDLAALQPQPVTITSSGNINGTKDDGRAGPEVQDTEWQKMIVSSQKKDEYIADLEKHLVFYKAKAKQMQVQLQQLIRSSSNNNDEDHTAAEEENARLQQRVRQLEETNDALMKDLATAKVVLSSSKVRSSTTSTASSTNSARSSSPPTDAERHASPRVVRISKSELREVNPLLPTLLEVEHVHKVYDSIAPHFSHTRHHPWPLVTEFLHSLDAGAMVADVGCGNGKYLRVNPALSMIGSDRSIPLLHCSADGSTSNLFGCDALALPLRSRAFDAAISIAVLLHISTVERRIALISVITLVGALSRRLWITYSLVIRRSCVCSELARIVKVGGELFIVAWAFEQDESSKRQFDSQDVMVEWKLQEKYAPAEQLTTHAKEDKARRWVVYQRYCHVYRQGELEELVAQVPGLRVISSAYSRSNWCLPTSRHSSAVSSHYGFAVASHIGGSDMVDPGPESRYRSDSDDEDSDALDPAEGHVSSDGSGRGGGGSRSDGVRSDGDSESDDGNLLGSPVRTADRDKTQDEEADLDDEAAAAQIAVNAMTFARRCIQDGHNVKALSALQAVIDANLLRSTATREAILLCAQIFFVAGDWDSAARCLLDIVHTMPAPYTAQDGALIMVRAYVILPISHLDPQLNSLLSFVNLGQDLFPPRQADTRQLLVVEDWHSSPNGSRPSYVMTIVFAHRLLFSATAAVNDQDERRRAAFELARRIAIFGFEGPGARFHHQYSVKSFYLLLSTFRDHFPRLYPRVIGKMDDCATKIAKWRRYIVRRREARIRRAEAFLLRAQQAASVLAPAEAAPIKKKTKVVKKKSTHRVSPQRDPKVERRQFIATKRRSTIHRNSVVHLLQSVKHDVNGPESPDEHTSSLEKRRSQRRLSRISQCSTNKLNLNGNGSEQSSPDARMRRRQSTHKIMMIPEITPTTEAASMNPGGEDSLLQLYAFPESSTSPSKLRPHSRDESERSQAPEPTTALLGFANLDLQELEDFVRMAHYRSRVLTHKHQKLAELTPESVKPPWLRSIDEVELKLTEQVAREQQTPLSFDMKRHLTIMHSRLLFQLEKLLADYKQLWGTTHFGLEMTTFVHSFSTWQYATTKHALEALQRVKSLGVEEEERRNLEFHHIRRAAGLSPPKVAHCHSPTI